MTNSIKKLLTHKKIQYPIKIIDWDNQNLQISLNKDGERKIIFNGSKFDDNDLEMVLESVLVS